MNPVVMVGDDVMNQVKAKKKINPIAPHLLGEVQVIPSLSSSH
ncbi:hypothetical protein C5167_013695 [Papaver somniferum]|uniref:Uncharacterized protein n=1 Tax=Papaver somniferum TaxID=3469 RepID=A0A4Y7J522_PAPSO|nr:hypothetical protein C5167_013695 [Papaver somniferum]